MAPAAPSKNSCGTTMNSWQEDLLNVAETADSPDALFRAIERGAQALGFDLCAYGHRMPVPVSNPKTLLLNNYPIAWQQRYAEAGYIDIDPTVLHGRRSQVPLIWNTKLFENAPKLWDEARSFG